jgi:hypothetical protein
MQLAVGFTGQQLGVGLGAVAEDDVDGAGVGRESVFGCWPPLTVTTAAPFTVTT